MTNRPQPSPTALTQGFWDAAARGELVVQRCDRGHLRHYPQELCPQCHSAEWEWVPVEGRGTIYSYTVTHRAFHPAWADRIPFAVVTVELADGVRLISDLPPGDTDEVRIGAPVEVFFDPQPDGMTLPRFRLTKPSAGSHRS